MRVPLQHTGLKIADFVLTSPVVSWTWSGVGEHAFVDTLPEFRPSDRETVREMMAGRYLFASKLVDSHGISPFALERVNPAWWHELHSFAWLRHFRDSPSAADKRFARMLVLDWVGRHSDVKARTWAPALTAVRVMNILRHLPVLTGDISAEQQKTLNRSLSTQIQSLKVRGSIAADPLDELMPAIALLAVELCENSTDRTVAERMGRLRHLLNTQFDEDGLHLSRNATMQFAILTELVSLRQALGQRHRGLLGMIGPLIDKMHAALGALIMGNGEPAYFNGSGQLPVDLVLGLQSQAEVDFVTTSEVSGYGVLVSGPSKIVIDSGRVPPGPFSRSAHASGLAFEFSHGSDLVVCNCGPAPPDLKDNRYVFRLAAAHSGPSLGGQSTARLAHKGPQRDHLEPVGQRPHLHMDAEDCGAGATTFAFEQDFGVHLRRNITLIADGDTLVGQDTVLPAARPRDGNLTLRFHLAPGAEASRRGNDDLIVITLKSGAQWTFLWEGGQAEIEDSVRQSAYFGFFRTQQIVIEAEIHPNQEISWIFTRQA